MNFSLANIIITDFVQQDVNRC